LGFSKGCVCLYHKILKGIAFILFGILLCLGSGELNHVVLIGVSYIPFSLIGVVSGAVGLILIFVKSKDEKEK